jgi:citrate lyase subunit beta/citryl-CoA lyase
MLFAGATRPDLVAKLGRGDTSIAVIDLEDAVPYSAKDRARSALPELIASVSGTKVLVRVNGAATRWFKDDLEAVVDLRLDGIVLPEVSDASELQRTRSVIGKDRLLGAGIETAPGVFGCFEILRDGGPDLVYFGAEDYIADLGGRRTAAGLEALYARSQVVLAARLASVPALDQIVPDFRDDERFRADAEAGRDLGYRGKMCIHPSQVAIANRVFGGSEEELRRARALLSEWRDAAARGVAAIDFEGQMVDGPALKMAEETIARAEGRS